MALTGLKKLLRRKAVGKERGNGGGRNIAIGKGEKSMDYNKLIKLCEGRRVWIQTHNFPDPDAISSAFALSEFLGHWGIQTELCHDGEIDKLSSVKMLTILDTALKKASEIEDMKTEDMIILVDCQKNAGNTTDFIGDEVAVIDHHPTFVQVDYEYKDLRITGACASLIAQYFKEAGIKPSSKAATALLYGMRMDTLQFSRGVTPFDIDMFGYLFPYVDQQMLGELETNNMEFQDLHGYGVAIDNIKVYGVVGFSYLDNECPDALVGILSDFLLSLVEVEVVVLYAKRADGVKFSFRSERDDVHAGEFAKKCLKGWGNGGGHATMAGGFVADGILPSDTKLKYAAVLDHFIEIIKEEYPQIL